MRQLLVYSDDLSWGRMPVDGERLTFEKRWPGVLENALTVSGLNVRVIEDCLIGRCAGADNPKAAGRFAMSTLPLALETHAPVELVILMLGYHDIHSLNSEVPALAEHLSALVKQVRIAPHLPGMPTPDILLVSPLLEKRVQQDELNVALKQVCEQDNCHFFESNEVLEEVHQGVCLEEQGHFTLGIALADAVGEWLSQHFVDSHWQ